MRLEQSPSHTQTNAHVRTTQFGIEKSPFAFKILIEKLYKDKPKTVARELLSNAWDAHVAAGTTDRPIEIVTPNYASDEFQIRDYGTGLPPDQLMFLMGTMFASNKRDSDAPIGGFGLGCKTPLCLTKAFTIEDRYEGTLYTFLVGYHDDSGAPTITAVHEQPTTEPNGLTYRISLGSDTNHRDEFTSALHTYARYFPTPPTINLEPAPPIEYSVKAKNWAILKENAFSNITVMVGPVPYNISAHDIDPQLRHNGALYGVVLFADIGDVNVTVSRENLEFTSKTRATLTRLFSNFQTENTEMINKEIDKCPTLWDALKYLANLENNLNRSFFSGVSAIKYKGQDIRRTIEDPNAALSPQKSPKFTFTKIGYKRRQQKASKHEQSNTLHFVPGLTAYDIWINNRAVGNVGKMKYHYDTMNPTHKPLLIINARDREDWNTALNAMGNPPIAGYIHELDPVPKEKRTASNKRTRVKKMGNYIYAVKDAEEVDIDPETAPGYWIEIFSNKYVDSQLPNKLYNLVNTFQAGGHDIYYFPKTVTAPSKNSSLIKLTSDNVVEEAIKLITPDLYMRYALYKHSTANVDNTQRADLISGILRHNVSGVAAHPALVRIADAAASVIRRRREIPDLIRSEITLPAPDTTYQDEIEQLFSARPLIRSLTSLAVNGCLSPNERYKTVSVKDLNDYIGNFSF